MPEQERDVVLIADILTQSSAETRFDYIATKGFRRQSFGDIDVVAAGSGAQALFDVLPHFIEQFQPLRAELHPAVWSRLLGLNIQAHFVGYERATGQNIRDFWGGAIEVAGPALNGSRFEKIGDVLHAMWVGKKNSEGLYDFDLAQSFIKYDYFKDAFVVHHFKWQDHGQGNVLSDEVRVYTPILGRRADYDLSQLTLDMTYSRLSTVIVVPPDLVQNVHIAKQGSNDVPLRLVRTGTLPRPGKLGILFGSDMMEFVRHVAEKLRGRSSK